MALGMELGAVYFMETDSGAQSNYRPPMQMPVSLVHRSLVKGYTMTISLLKLAVEHHIGLSVLLHFMLLLTGKASFSTIASELQWYSSFHLPVPLGAIESLTDSALSRMVPISVCLHKTTMLSFCYVYSHQLHVQRHAALGACFKLVALKGDVINCYALSD